MNFSVFHLDSLRMTYLSVKLCISDLSTKNLLMNPDDHLDDLQQTPLTVVLVTGCMVLQSNSVGGLHRASGGYIVIIYTFYNFILVYNLVEEIINQSINFIRDWMIYNRINPFVLNDEFRLIITHHNQVGPNECNK